MSSVLSSQYCHQYCHHSIVSIDGSPPADGLLLVVEVAPFQQPGDHHILTQNELSDSLSLSLSAYIVKVLNFSFGLGLITKFVYFHHRSRKYRMSMECLFVGNNDRCIFLLNTKYEKATDPAYPS